MQDFVKKISRFVRKNERLSDLFAGVMLGAAVGWSACVSDLGLHWVQGPQRQPAALQAARFITVQVEQGAETVLRVLGPARAIPASARVLIEGRSGYVLGSTSFYRETTGVSRDGRRLRLGLGEKIPDGVYRLRLDAAGEVLRTSFVVGRNDQEFRARIAAWRKEISYWQQHEKKAYRTVILQHHQMVSSLPAVIGESRQTALAAWLKKWSALKAGADGSWQEPRLKKTHFPERWLRLASMREELSRNVVAWAGESESERRTASENFAAWLIRWYDFERDSRRVSVYF